MFELKTSVHGMHCVEESNLSEATVARIVRLMRANRWDDPDYKIKDKSHPFLQGNERGWILIEFWTVNLDAINDFITYLNHVTRQQESK